VQIADFTTNDVKQGTNIRKKNGPKKQSFREDAHLTGQFCGHSWEKGSNNTGTVRIKQQ
jgi:hypothetical protein